MVAKILQVAKAIAAFLVAAGGYEITRPITGDSVTDTTNVVIAVGLGLAAAVAVYAVPNKAPAS